MWDTLSTPWQTCAALAWVARCADCYPIGALITGPDGRILSTGRNRIFEPREAGPRYLAGMPLAHAEMNALLTFDCPDINPRECTLYTTTEPCPMCAGVLLMANIRHVRYACRDPFAGSANLFTLSPYMSRKHTDIEGPADQRFEAVLAAIQVEFFLRLGAIGGEVYPLARPNPIIDALEVAVPTGVALGRQLFVSGELQDMRAANLPAGQVFDRLSEMLEPRAAAGEAAVAASDQR